MGRGRAKAKQQKVARELKYSSHLTDLDALQRELGASAPTANGRGGESAPDASADEDDDYDDPALDDPDYEDSDADDRSANRR
jgi:hypothetical protein